MANNTDETRAPAQARILIVDDDDHTRDILCRWLRREGYAATPAESGASCLEAMQQGEFDVIVLDVMMPAMDGLEVCKRLQENQSWRAVPVILLTAKDDMETRGRGMVLGVSEYLTKPVSRGELINRVQAQVRSRSLERTLSRQADAIGKSQT